MRGIRTFFALFLALFLTLPALSEASMPTVEPDMPDSAARVVDPALIPADALPDEPRISLKWAVYNGSNARIPAYERGESISFGLSDDFTPLEGITTFRGNNYRDSAAYGTIGAEPTDMSVLWRNSIGRLDEWSGVGWTGQCSIVRWPDETRRIMNLYPEKKAKDGLVEVIYATLDGHIYFYDLADGEPTRDAIDIGAPIKGSLSIDPRGYPLLYCGQGIDEVRGKSVKIGTRIFSLIDGSVLHFINGRDDSAIRRWYAFDSSPLIHAESDTMLQLGENGIFYTVKLNTRYDPAAGTISINPQVIKYVYTSDVSDRPGMEDSVAVYNHYAFFTDNSGLIQCVDIDGMRPLWARFAGDDTDSTIVLEPEESGLVALYTANELDRRGDRGDCNIRKVNALTGELVWQVNERCKRKGDANGGAFATPALGKGSLGDYVYFHIARTEDGGTLLCIDKETGEVAWRRSLKTFGWSSPVCVYADTGRGYVAVASASGQLRLIDGLTGNLVCDLDLGSNVEASPAVFGDILVVGTREQKIIAVKFE